MSAGPPRVTRTLLAWALRHEDRPHVLADLEEEFEAVAARRGRRAARRWARGQALRSIAPSLRRRLSASTTPGPTGPRKRGIGAAGRLARELRTAVRAVLRSPAYAATVIVTFALAIGANVAVFSVVNGILLRPLPYAQPDELVMVHRVTDFGEEGAASYPDFRDWRSEAESFGAYAAYTGHSATYLGPESAEHWDGVQSTLDLFRVLGVPPLHGRTYSPETDAPHAEVLVLGHGLWQRRFGGDPEILGRSVRLEGGRSKTVIGVMPPGFYFPEPDAQYWTPLESADWLENRHAWFLRSIGRLAPGVDLAEAESELGAIVARVDLATASGDGEPGRIRVEKRHEAYVGSTRTLFTILLGAVGLVLAIACANIANLGLTRATAREREFAVRSALGAGRATLIRQLLGESVILSLFGAAAGVVVSVLVVGGLVAIGPEEIPRLDEVAVDSTALGFALVVAIACGILFGIAPALHGARSGLGAGLREGGRGSDGPGRRRTLQSLVVSQIALAVVLVVGAGLLLHSFLRLSAERPGFDTARVLTVEVSLPSDRYGEPERVEAFYREMERRAVALPSVDAFGYTSHLPFSGSNLQATYLLDGEADHADGREPVAFEVIGEDYPRAIGLTLVAGRPLVASDRSGAPQVALVNEEFVRRNWPGENPIGKRFTLDGELEHDQWHTVVGVVGDVRKEGLDEERRPIAYYSRAQFHELFGLVSGRHGYMTFRTLGDPGAAIGAIRREVAEVDPHLPMVAVRTTGELVSRSLAEARFRTLLIGGFALLALLVALVGIYGVMAFVVTRRTREIGIRMALGASSPRILLDVVRRGAVWIGVGLAIGLVGGLASSRVLSALLYGVSASDPLTYALVALGLTVAGLAACYLPARRAAALDPLDALREE